MRRLIAALGLLALAAGAYALLSTADDQGSTVPETPVTAQGADTERDGSGEPSALRGEPTGSACGRLARVTAEIAEGNPSPLALLRALGRRAAGIRPPPRAFGDLARGGRDLLPGGGFSDRYDDGTSGQARHFAGIAVATTVVGGAVPTRLISERFRDDPRGSADGRLTEAGIAFASRLRSGELPLADAPAWILRNLCAP